MESTFEPVAPPPPAEETSDEKKGGLSPVYFWVGAGATVVFGGLTLAMALAAESKWEDAENKLNDPWGGNTSDIASDIRALQIVGYVSLALTGAALIATAVFIPFTNWGKGEGKENDVSWTFGPWGAPESGGLSLSGRF